MLRDARHRTVILKALDPVDPTGRNATCSHVGRYFFKSFRIGVLDG
jgi:hypothetical protein